MDQSILETVITEIRKDIAAVRAENAATHEEITEIKRVLPIKGYRTNLYTAHCFGMTLDYIRRSPWMQPHWGRSDIPGREKRWMIETWEDWFRVSPAERKRQWEKMTFADRQKICGAA